MSTTHGRLRRLTALEADAWGVLLAALFIGVMVGAVELATWFAGAGVEPAMSGSSSSEQAAAGAGWAIAEVAVAVVGLGVILLWRRLPEWAKDVVKTGAVVVVSMVLGVQAAAVGASAFWTAAGLLVSYYAIIKATDAYDVYWIWNNFEAVLLAIVLAGAIGSVLPLPFLLVGIVLLSVYDHVFANERDWMFTLGEGMMRAKLPVLVLALPRLRVSWDALCRDIGGDEDVLDEELSEAIEAGNGFGIGMADLMLPAAVAAAVAVSTGGVTMPVFGIAVGVVIAAFRLRWLMVNQTEGGAGMPSITTGVIGGYAITVLPWVVLG